MKPLQLIDYGEALDEERRREVLHEHRNHVLLHGVLQYLRDEAYAALAVSLKAKREGKNEESTLALGAFDGLSQVIVKLKAASEMAVKVG